MANYSVTKLLIVRLYPSSTMNIHRSFNSHLRLSTVTGRLDSQSIVAMLDILAKRGHVEWESPKKQSCLIMWRTPEEWGKLIYSWVGMCAIKAVQRFLLLYDDV